MTLRARSVNRSNIRDLLGLVWRTPCRSAAKGGDRPRLQGPARLYLSREDEPHEAGRSWPLDEGTAVGSPACLPQAVSGAPSPPSPPVKSPVCWSVHAL